MRIISHVAVNVLKESVRQKIPYSLVLFAVLLIVASNAISQLTAGQDAKIIKDLGLAAISIFGLLMAMFAGVSLLWKEIDRRSIDSILSKPIQREAFVLGKYCVLVLTLFVNLSVMTLAFYAVLAYMREADPFLLVAILLIFVELMLVTAVALFFSTLSSRFLSVMLTLGVWIAGHLNADLRDVDRVVPRVARLLGRALYYVLPNFAAFDVKSQVVYGQPIAAGYVALTTLYGVTYAAFVLTAAMAIVRRQDF